MLKRRSQKNSRLP